MSQTASDETFVQVAADGSGKQIRNRAVQVLLSDGTMGTVYMQVTALADEYGHMIDLKTLDFQTAVLHELRAIARGLEVLTGDNLHTE